MGGILEVSRLFRILSIEIRVMALDIGAAAW